MKKSLDRDRMGGRRRGVGDANSAFNKVSHGCHLNTTAYSLFSSGLRGKRGDVNRRKRGCDQVRGVARDEKRNTGEIRGRGRERERKAEEKPKHEDRAEAETSETERSGGRSADEEEEEIDVERNERIAPLDDPA